MHFTRLTAMLAALLVGTAAAAEPVVVEYFVDRKALKAFTATDVLEFELYEDESCSVTIGTYPLFGGDQYAHFFVDKRHRVLGAGRVAKAVRIHAVLDAPVMGHAPYLRVTGPGITPVGDECQLQAGSPVRGPVPSGTGRSDGSGAGPQGRTRSGGRGWRRRCGRVRRVRGPRADGADGAPRVTEGPAGPQGPAGADGAPGAEGPAGPAGSGGRRRCAGCRGSGGSAGSGGRRRCAGRRGSGGSAGPGGRRRCAGRRGSGRVRRVRGPGRRRCAGRGRPDGSAGPQGPAGADGAQGSQGIPACQATSCRASLNGQRDPQDVTAQLLQWRSDRRRFQTSIVSNLSEVVIDGERSECVRYVEGHR